MTSQIENLPSKNKTIAISQRYCYKCVNSKGKQYDIYIIDLGSNAGILMPNESGLGTPGGSITTPIYWIDYQCPSCGMTYSQGQQTIPINQSSIICSRCGKGETFEYRVNQINAKKESFEFEVDLICENCRNKKTLKTTVNRFLSVLRIEIGPTKISEIHA
jgi:5-methylcytosine-specific restriction endonuclease McrA